MYEVSEQYKAAIRKQTRKYEWRGTITASNGKVYHFTNKDIVKGSGTLTRSCAGSTSLELGSVYAAELDISLFLDVDRYSLYDAVIDLTFVCQHSVKRLWNDLIGQTWNALRSTRWNDKGAAETIAMGRFVVAEATRTMTVLQLKAYDYMLKFEKNMKNSGTVRTPYEWLEYACNACNVPLGLTEAEVASMPNGTRRLSYTNLEEKQTYRISKNRTCHTSDHTSSQRTGKCHLVSKNKVPGESQNQLAGNRNAGILCRHQNSNGHISPRSDELQEQRRKMFHSY